MQAAANRLLRAGASVATYLGLRLFQAGRWLLGRQRPTGRRPQR